MLIRRCPLTNTSSPNVNNNRRHTPDRPEYVRAVVKKRIVEQVSELSVSRQRKWQLRQKQKGLCQKCSKPAVPESVYCVGHMVYHRVAALRRYQPKRGRMRQHRGTKSHRLAAAAQGDLRRLLPSDVQKLLASRHPEQRELARRALNERPELRPSARWEA